MVLGIDASMSSSGYSIVTQDKEVVKYGKIITKKEDFKDDVERLTYICNTLEDIIKPYNIKLCILEDSIPVRNSKSVLQLNILKGMIIRTLQKNGINTKLIYPSSVKKMVTGDGRATKGQIAKSIQINLIDIGEYSDKQTKNKEKTSDIYDSLALVLAYLNNKGDN